MDKPLHKIICRLDSRIIRSQLFPVSSYIEKEPDKCADNLTCTAHCWDKHPGLHLKRVKIPQIRFQTTCRLKAGWKQETWISCFSVISTPRSNEMRSFAAPEGSSGPSDLRNSSGTAAAARPKLSATSSNPFAKLCKRQNTSQLPLIRAPKSWWHAALLKGMSTH